MIDPYLTPATAEARLRDLVREFRQLADAQGMGAIVDALGTVSSTQYQSAIRYSKHPELAAKVLALVEEVGWLTLNDRINRSNVNADTP